MTKAGKTWPHHEVGNKLSNWGRQGDHDEIRTLNPVSSDGAT